MKHFPASAPFFFPRTQWSSNRYCSSFYWWGTSGPESIIAYGHSYQGPETEFTCLFTRLQLKKTSCVWCLFEFHLDLCTRGSWWCLSRERTQSCGLEKGCKTQGPHCAGEGRKRLEEEKLELGSQCGWDMDPQGRFHKCSKLKLWQLSLWTWICPLHIPTSKF